MMRGGADHGNSGCRNFFRAPRFLASAGNRGGLAGIADSQSFVYSLAAYAKAQTRLQTTTDGFVDLAAQGNQKRRKHYGIVRGAAEAVRRFIMPDSHGAGRSTSLDSIVGGDIAQALGAGAFI